MSSPEEQAFPVSLTSMPSPSYSSSILENYVPLNERLNIHQNVRRIPMRHRTWWFLLLMTAAGILFANLVWNFVQKSSKQAYAELLEAQRACGVGVLDPGRFVPPENVRIVALVSYTARSRTSILECYLQSNLAINDGLLDQVIFVPETGQETEMDWLHALVQSTPGYLVLETPKYDGDDYAGINPMADNPDTEEVSEQDVGTGPFARAWDLALSMSQAKTSSPETQEDDIPNSDSTPSSVSEISTTYIFVHGETIFLAHDAISKVLQTHFIHPSYTFIHANMINQPVLSWVHHHLGVICPYRPETEPPIRHHWNKTTTNQEAKEKPGFQHPWRASELPLWRDSHRTEGTSIQHSQSPDEIPAERAQDFPPTDGPSFFNIPIDFHSPFRGHRWLPYHPHESHPPSHSQPDEPTSPQSNIPHDAPQSGSIATPVTQAMMSLQRPGKWPWTLSALHLYSFLEHLECTHPYSLSTTDGNATTSGHKHRPNCTAAGGLERYNMGLWEYQAEKYGMSLFAIDSATIGKIGALPNGVSEAEILRKSGGGMAIDGGSIAARFVGSAAEDGVGEKRGLESTDLLQRFETLSWELGGCDGHGVL